MNKKNESLSLPFKIEALALFLIPFEETLALSVGSMLRIVNIMSLLSGLAYLRIRDKKMLVDRVACKLLVFYVFMIVSAVWCFNFGLYFDRLSTYTLGISLIIVLQLLEPNEREKNLLINALWLGGTAVSFLILYSSAATINIGGRETLVLFGRQVDPNYLAFSVILSFVINLYYLFYKNNRTLIKMIFCATQVILAYTIIALGSRGAFLSMSVMMAIIVLNVRFEGNSILKKILLILCAVIVAYVFYTGVLESGGEMSRFTIDNLLGKGELGTAKRTDIWHHALEQFFNRPILGYGLGSAPYAIANVYRFVGTHNSYIMVLLEFGMIGFCLFVSWQVSFLKRLFGQEDKIYFFLELALLLFIIFIEGFPTKAFWGALIVMFVGSSQPDFYYEMEEYN